MRWVYSKKKSLSPNQIKVPTQATLSNFSNKTSTSLNTLTNWVGKSEWPAFPPNLSLCVIIEGLWRGMAASHQFSRKLFPSHSFWHWHQTRVGGVSMTRFGLLRRNWLNQIPSCTDLSRGGGNAKTGLSALKKVQFASHSSLKQSRLMDLTARSVTGLSGALVV
jgi:hypothetical protein